MLLLYQVVETFNSYCAKFQKFVNPMSIMRAQEMLLVTSSIHNTALREKKYEKAELSHGKGNVGLDVWRRETSLDEELTVVAAPRQVPASSQAVAHAATAASAAAAASARTPSEAAPPQAVAHAATAATAAAAAVPSASARTPSEAAPSQAVAHAAAATAATAAAAVPAVSTLTNSEAAILDGESAFVAAPRQVQPTAVTAPQQVPAAFQAPSQVVTHAAAATAAAAAAVPAVSTFTNSEASRLLRGVSQTPVTDTASNPNFVSLSESSSSESDTDVSSSTAVSVPASRGSDSSSQNGSDSDSDVEVGSNRHRKRLRRKIEMERTKLREESGAFYKQAREAFEAKIIQQEQLKVSSGGAPCFIAARCVTLVHTDLPYSMLTIQHAASFLLDMVSIPWMIESSTQTSVSAI